MNARSFSARLPTRKDAEGKPLKGRPGQTDRGAQNAQHRRQKAFRQSLVKAVIPAHQAFMLMLQQQQQQQQLQEQQRQQQQQQQPVNGTVAGQQPDATQQQSSNKDHKQQQQLKAGHQEPQSATGGSIQKLAVTIASVSQPEAPQMKHWAEITVTACCPSTRLAFSGQCFPAMLTCEAKDHSTAA